MLTLEVSTIIATGTSKVWDALTNPAIIKQYMFGTDTTSDWKVGSRITYKGIWQGKEYEDGGTITELEPEKKLVSTYWSSMSGTEDKPENYATVGYFLEPTEKGTKLTITQNNIKTEEAKEHLISNWNMILDTMKKILE